MAGKKVRNLTNEQRGIYINALCDCWMDEGLPADDAELRAYFQDVEEGAYKVLAGCFNVPYNGKLWDKRLLLEFMKLKREREKMAEGGKTSKGASKVLTSTMPRARSREKSEVRSQKSEVKDSKEEKKKIKTLTADKAPPDTRIKEILDFYNIECKKVGITGDGFPIGAILIKRYLKRQTPEFLKEMIVYRLNGGNGLQRILTLDQIFKSYNVNKYMDWATIDAVSAARIKKENES